MDKMHQNQLTARLEDAYLNGCSHITWNELYHWYGVKKIAAGTLRDLQSRWEDISEGETGALMQVSGRGGIFIFGKESIKPVFANGDTE